LDLHDFAEHYYETVINTCPISYLWHRDYLLQKGVPFVEDRQMEDFDFIEQNVYNANTIAYSTAIVYRVNIREPFFHYTYHQL